MQSMSFEANITFGQRSKTFSFENVPSIQCISQDFVTPSMFGRLTMHGNDFKHHLLRLYLISNHMGSYKNSFKICQKWLFGKEL